MMKPTIHRAVIASFCILILCARLQSHAATNATANVSLASAITNAIAPLLTEGWTVTRVADEKLYARDDFATTEVHLWNNHPSAVSNELVLVFFYAFQLSSNAHTDVNVALLSNSTIDVRRVSLDVSDTESAALLAAIVKRMTAKDMQALAHRSSVALREIRQRALAAADEDWQRFVEQSREEARERLKKPNKTQEGIGDSAEPSE